MKKFWIHSLAVTLFVFVMMWVGSKVTDLAVFNAFDPISQALSDFELTDYAFSNLRPDPKVDQRVVLVNIGNLSRREVAQQLRIISQYKPRVVGIDAFYNCEGGLYDTVNCPQLLDTLGNLMLSSAIADAGNVVLVEKLMQSDSLRKALSIDSFDSVEYSDPMFSGAARANAFANLPTGANYQEDVKICRSIFPKMKVKDKRELAFSVQMSMLYDSVKTNKFLARDNEEEVINFRGNVELEDNKLKSMRDVSLSTTNYPVLFFAIDWDKVLAGDFDPSLFKDRVVIMGFLGANFGDPAWNDKFFTPLNKKVAGRANPDMFGPVIHANTVAMILNEDYVDQLSDWQMIGIAFLVCILTVALFVIIDNKLPAWFDALSVIIQLFQILIASGLVVYVYAGYSFKLDLSLTLATSALVGPCYDIYKSIQNEVLSRLTKRRERVLNANTP